MYSTLHTLLYSLPVGLLVLLLNLLELLLSVEHVCFPHDLVLTLAVNFILLVLAL